MNDTNQLLTELRQHPQWVCHTAAKLPLNPRTGYAASSTNSQDWGTYEEAVAAATAHAGVGIGFVLTERDNYVCIDLDSYKTSDPAIVASHEEIKRQFSNTYSERSPNGGTHIWGKGSIPRSVKSSQQHIEIYDRARYMTFTGNAINNLPLASCNGNLTRLLEQLQSQQSKPVPTLVLNQPQVHADDDLCRQAANASNGGKFIELWNGRWQQFPEYPSQSEADQALNNIIAFYTDNPEQVARVFRASALGQRDKAKRNDYVGNMVRRAFDQKTPMIPAESIAAIQSQWPIQNVSLSQPIQVLTKRHVEVISVADIQPENIKWFWRHWLALGKLAILAGGPGIGKSTLTLNLAAIASNGGSWPDGTSAPAGHVLIWSNEDDIKDTVVPRLWAAGAKLKNVHIISGTTDTKGEKLPFSPATDIPLLKEMILATHNVVLVIIDPVVAAVEKDMNQTNIVRKSLQPLVDFASEIGCCVLGITHFRKSSEGQDPIERILGSGAFGALPRTIIVAAKDKSSERRVVALAKGNVGQDTGGFDYTIESAVIASDIHTSKLVWGNVIEGSARDILASVEATVEAGDEPSSKLDEAKQFLAAQLANGAQVPSVDLNKMAGNSRISAITLKRAMKSLGVITFPSGYGGHWLCRLPLKF